MLISSADVDERLPRGRRERPARCRRPHKSRGLVDDLPHGPVLALAAALAAVALAGCGHSAATTAAQNFGSPTSATAPVPTVVATAPTATSSTTRSASTPTTAPATRLPSHRPRKAPIAYSTASAQTVQAQPAPGSCHAIGSGLYSRPDRRCTPGALNPAVTQATLGQTICQPGWTRTVRPPGSVTEPEKAASMAAYGDTGPMSAYEYDHFVPLELGGAVNDPRNLWPEPGATPNPKDAVEDELHAKVCDGEMTLGQAQHAIVTDWVALAPPASPQASAAPASNPSATAPRASTPSTAGAECTLSASYNSRYHDYDVYLHSNQPEQTVTVTDATGHTGTWHTNATGYADVYLRAPADAAGETVTAHVGGASCQATL